MWLESITPALVYICATLKWGGEGKDEMRICKESVRKCCVEFVKNCLWKIVVRTEYVKIVYVSSIFFFTFVSVYLSLIYFFVYTC